MEKLHISFMRELINIDFEGIYWDIIKLMKKKKVDDINIQLAFARVKPHVKKFDALRNRQRNENSILNEQLTRTRTDYLISLRLRVHSYMRSHIPEERVAAKRINFVLKMYGKKYYVPNILSQAAFVDEIVIHIKRREDFKEAFTLLGLTDLMDTIVKMTEEIMKNFGQRISDDGNNKARNNGVRKEAYKDMKIMIDAINFMYVINKDNEEKREIAEDLMWYINKIFKTYRTPMRSRQTKRKNRKAVAAAVNELIRTQQEPQKTLPVGDSLELKPTGSVKLTETGVTPVAPIHPFAKSISSTIQNATPSSVSGVNDEMNDTKPNSTIPNKGKGDKGGKNDRDILPPINMN